MQRAGVWAKRVALIVGFLLMVGGGAVWGWIYSKSDWPWYEGPFGLVALYFGWGTLRMLLYIGKAVFPDPPNG